MTTEGVFIMECSLGAQGLQLPQSGGEEPYGIKVEMNPPTSMCHVGPGLRVPYTNFLKLASIWQRNPPRTQDLSGTPVHIYLKISDHAYGQGFSAADLGRNRWWLPTAYEWIVSLSLTHRTFRSLSGQCVCICLYLHEAHFREDLCEAGKWRVVVIRSLCLGQVHGTGRIWGRRED